MHRRVFFYRVYVPARIPSMETKACVKSTILHCVTFVCPAVGRSIFAYPLCFIVATLALVPSDGWIASSSFARCVERDVWEGKLKVRPTSASREEIFASDVSREFVARCSFCSAGDEAGRARVLVSRSLCASCKVRGSKARNDAHRSMPRACASSNCNDAVYCRIWRHRCTLVPSGESLW